MCSFYDIPVCLVGDFDSFSLFFSLVYLLGLSTELYIGIVGESSFRVMDNISRDLTFSYEIVSYITIFLALYVSLRILPCFLHMSIGGCFIFSG